MTEPMEVEGQSKPTSTISPDVIEKLSGFNEALSNLEESLQPHFSTDFEKHLERSALEMARADLMSMFTLNSIAWTLCSMRGYDPRENVKLVQDLKRTKDYVNRLKKIESRKAAPRVNPVAARNFVRNALFEIPPPKDKSSTQDTTEEE